MAKNLQLVRERFDVMNAIKPQTTERWLAPQESQEYGDGAPVNYRVIRRLCVAARQEQTLKLQVAFSKDCNRISHVPRGKPTLCPDTVTWKGVVWLLMCYRD